MPSEDLGVPRVSRNVRAVNGSLQQGTDKCYGVRYATVFQCTREATVGVKGSEHIVQEVAKYHLMTERGRTKSEMMGGFASSTAVFSRCFPEQGKYRPA